MTEAMPFLQKAILLSYDPRPFAGGYLFVGFCLNSMKVPFVTKESLQTIFEEYPMSFYFFKLP